MVIRAVEMLLDKYDRKISDRYKMIDYQEQDNQKEIIQLSNKFLNVTIVCHPPASLCYRAMPCGRLLESEEFYISMTKIDPGSRIPPPH